MKLRNLILILIVLASSIAVLGQSNETEEAGGGSSSSNASSLAGGGSLPLIVGGKIYKAIYFSEPVRSIEFEISDNVWTGRPFPQGLNELPLAVSYLDNSRNVYTYFNILAPKINKSNLAFAELKLNVKKDWMGKKDIQLDAVELLIYEENGWTDSGVTLEYFGENSEEYFYLAQVSDFSYFAIVEKKDKLVVEEAVNDTKEEIIEAVVKTEKTIVIAKEKQDFTMFFFFAAVVLILLLMYLLKKKKS